MARGADVGIVDVDVDVLDCGQGGNLYSNIVSEGITVNGWPLNVLITKK